jgi:hypothetical protein
MINDWNTLGLSIPSGYLVYHKDTGKILCTDPKKYILESEAVLKDFSDIKDSREILGMYTPEIQEGMKIWMRENRYISDLVRENGGLEAFGSMPFMMDSNGRISID